MNLDFSSMRVLLVGDFMIDHYIMGISNRMSPEAPVPVVIPEQEYSIPGGAGNVAMNLRAMGAHVTCVGVVGNDLWGKELISILNNEGINVDNMAIIDNHPTTLKKRIYANGTQVARIDQEKPFSDTYPFVNFSYDNFDVIILSDYDKGVFHRPWFIKPENSNVILDPKSLFKHLYMNTNIITPNLNELNMISGNKIDDNKSIVDACTNLIKDFNLDYIVAKKGDQGMTIVGKDNLVKHIAAHSVESPDVTGAGDTVIALLSLMYTKTQDIELSAKIANAAAALVVGEPGTATISIDKIQKFIEKNK